MEPENICFARYDGDSVTAVCVASPHDFVDFDMELAGDVACEEVMEEAKKWRLVEKDTALRAFEIDPTHRAGEGGKNV